MKDPEKPQEESTDERLPYEPPEVISETVFETLALACQHNVGFPCAGYPPRS